MVFVLEIIIICLPTLVASFLFVIYSGVRTSSRPTNEAESKNVMFLVKPNMALDILCANLIPTPK